MGALACTGISSFITCAAMIAVPLACTVTPWLPPIKPLLDQAAGRAGGCPLRLFKPILPELTHTRNDQYNKAKTACVIQSKITPTLQNYTVEFPVRTWIRVPDTHCSHRYLCSLSFLKSWQQQCELPYNPYTTPLYYSLNWVNRGCCCTHRTTDAFSRRFEGFHWTVASCRCCRVACRSVEPCRAVRRCCLCMGCHVQQSHRAARHL